MVHVQRFHDTWNPRMHSLSSKYCEKKNTVGKYIDYCVYRRSCLLWSSYNAFTTPAIRVLIGCLANIATVVEHTVGQKIYILCVPEVLFTVVHVQRFHYIWNPWGHLRGEICGKKMTNHTLATARLVIGGWYRLVGVRATQHQYTARKEGRKP